MGVSPGSVRHELSRARLLPSVTRILASLTRKEAQMPPKSFGLNVARKRCLWNKIDKSKLSENSFWNQAKKNSSLQLVGVDIDKDEVASLFTFPLNKTLSAPTNEVASNSKKPASKQKVQLTNIRRRTVNERKEFIAFRPNFERNGKDPNAVFINADRVEKIESSPFFEVEYAESCKVSGVLLPVSLRIAVMFSQQNFLSSLFHLDAQGWFFVCLLCCCANFA